MDVRYSDGCHVLKSILGIQMDVGHSDECLETLILRALRMCYTAADLVEVRETPICYVFEQVLSLRV